MAKIILIDEIERKKYRARVREGEVKSVGRGSENDIVLNSRYNDVRDSISRYHCGLRMIDGKLEICDYGSTNGTYVFGSKIMEGWTPLSQGSMVSLGFKTLEARLIKSVLERIKHRRKKK